jgi:uncharacterized membrane protein (DUF4010 family)
MDELITLLFQALTALGIGLLIGVERESHQRPVVNQRTVQRSVEAAGIRTFALVCLSGNLLTLLPEPLAPWAVGLGLMFTGLIALISYQRTSRGKSGDKGITSEVVLFISFILGALTGYGQLLPATILAVIILALLHYKSILHRFSHSLSQLDIRQTIQFLIITLIILPLLPDNTFGPYDALNPQRIWLMVVLISGIGFAAYVTIKFLGERAGLGVTGILGGIVSSTAVTLALARVTRKSPKVGTTCLLAIMLACGTMFPRILILTLLFSLQTATYLLIPVLIVSLFTLGGSLFLWRRINSEPAQLYEPTKNPLSLPMAVLFGLLYGAVLFFSHMAQFHFGEEGLFIVAGLSGIADVDAITLTISQMTAEGTLAETAARTILLAASVNSLVKLSFGVALTHPKERFRLAAALLPMVLIPALSIVLI